MKKLFLTLLILCIVQINIKSATNKTSITCSQCPMEYLTGSWEGIYFSGSHETQFKIVMHVTKINACDFEGHIDWLNYGNSQTKIKGYYKDGELHFIEVAKIQGPSHRLNTHYIAPWKGEPEFAGNTYYRQSKVGHFKLRRFLS